MKKVGGSFGLKQIPLCLNCIHLTLLGHIFHDKNTYVGRLVAHDTSNLSFVGGISFPTLLLITGLGCLIVVCLFVSFLDLGPPRCL